MTLGMDRTEIVRRLEDAGRKVGTDHPSLDFKGYRIFADFGMEIARVIAENNEAIEAELRKKDLID